MSPPMMRLRRRAGEAVLLGVRAALASVVAVAIAQSMKLTYARRWLRLWPLPLRKV